MKDTKCPICNRTSNNEKHPDMSAWTVRCNSCGIYTLNDNLYFSIEEKISKCTERQVINASYFLKSQGHYIINMQNVNNILSKKVPSFKDRYQKLLLTLEQECRHMGEGITISEEKYDLIESVWAFNFSEFMEFITYLEIKKYITINFYLPSTRQGGITITPEGWSHIEEIKTTNPDSTQCFIAMWFDKSMTTIYDSIIAPAIAHSGYNPHRVDRREHVGKIDDEIIAQIRRSKFVVADFTKHRGGVYYEAGFAHGLGLPVIMTCRDDYFSEIHFDIRQYNCIVWNQDNLDEFKKSLEYRIEAILGRGPLFHDA